MLWTFLPAVLAALTLCMPYQQKKTDQRIFNYYPGRSGKIWQGIETLPDGARLAYFGPSSFEYYPLFGRRLQFVPCKVNSEGLPYVPLHHRWRTDPENISWWGKKHTKPAFEDLMTNLANADVDYVLIARPQKGKWPRQQTILEESQRTQRVSGNEHFTVWKINLSFSPFPVFPLCDCQEKNR